MSSNTLPPVIEFSSSRVTEPSEHSEAITALGKKLVTEQGLDGSVDTLGRWMAHHIAELIAEAESTNGEGRTAKMANVREAVLALWAHRHVLPFGRSPFAGMEPIFNALESLDPDTPHFRYFSPSFAPGVGDKESEEVQRYVEMAKAIDRASKVIVNFCIAEAAQKALDSSKEWVRLAGEAEADEGFDITLIRIIADRSDLIKAPNPIADRRRILVDRKQKIEALVVGAGDLLNSINLQLEELPPDDQDDQDDSEIILKIGGD
ncbi:AVAST type 3 anti-phage proein Avs3b [Pseudomonas sp.]|uniref:AVAST type 3 anti-phage proein Avs3b n=1 Tax=Pseudomonas sp. TaxID=306 RepID=UPI0028A6955F|nr:AVAST type 3 anti-phage proein Avs3b [Pseudomonas sp.]